MTPDERRMVQQTFAVVEPIADEAAALFYARLLELDPSLRAMFPHDLREQRVKLMQALAIVVHGLDRLDRLVPVIEMLGRRHAGYGVLPSHYETVAEALLWTLEQGLGSAFTPEVRAAWAAAYAVLATTMQRAAAEPPAELSRAA